MAKENYISLRGQLKGDVTVRDLKVQGKEGKVAFFQLSVIRRGIYDRAGILSPQYDEPLIFTNDPDIIQRITDEKYGLKQNDAIEVKGLFRTSDSVRNCVCPSCGHKNVAQTRMQTIYPTFVDSLHSFDSSKDCKNYLINCAEVSNIAKILGRVCSPTVKTGETERGELYASYQLAVNRKLYIPGSENADDHADYPDVFSYGMIAENDALTLQQGALVYLDGYLRTKKFNQVVTCEECGQSFTFRNQYMTLSPYSMEYLRDFGELAPSTHEEIDHGPGEF